MLWFNIVWQHFKSVNGDVWFSQCCQSLCDKNIHHSQNAYPMLLSFYAQTDTGTLDAVCQPKEARHQSEREVPQFL